MSDNINESIVFFSILYNNNNIHYRNNPSILYVNNLDSFRNFILYTYIMMTKDNWMIWYILRLHSHVSVFFFIFFFCIFNTLRACFCILICDDISNKDYSTMYSIQKLMFEKKISLFCQKIPVMSNEALNCCISL